MRFRFPPDLRRWAAAAAAAMVSGLAATGAPAGPAHVVPAAFQGTCSLVQVDTVQFQPASGGGWSLYIAGLKQFANMGVSLENRVGPRGEWTLEVVGCTVNFLILPVPTQYWLDVPLRDLPNVRSIRVVGSNGVWRPKLPPR